MTSHEMNVLVNGNRCKLYNHQGKTYVEGKAGSEYEIEIKNNTGGKVEAVASVDGLSVLSGEAACDVDVGYVLSAYNSYRIKGFRYSDEKVGAFKFSSKEKSYASSQGEEAAKNCGVIACKLYFEKLTNIVSTVYHHYNTYTEPYWYTTSAGCSSLAGTSTTGTFTRCCDNTSTLAANNDNNNVTCKVDQPDLDNAVRYCSLSGTDGVGSGTPFTLGTEWGEAKESKVSSILFDRGVLAASFEIYYTDRAGLVALGVPLDNTANVSFPCGFPGNKYAKPPTGWKG